MFRDICNVCVNTYRFAIKYIKYLYYGLKQRLRALFKGELGIYKFLISLFKWPFESWRFAKTEMSYGY